MNYAADTKFLRGVLYHNGVADTHLDDAVSDVWVKVLKGNYEERGHWRAWLGKIAKNYAMTYHKKNRREPLFTSLEEVAVEDEPDKELLLQTIRGYAFNLPKRRRQVIYGALDGLSFGEILKKYGMSEGSASSARYRAVRKLRVMVA